MEHEHNQLPQHTSTRSVSVTPPHTDAFFMRRVAIRQDASTMHGRIVTDCNATHEKRIRVGRALRVGTTSVRSA